MIYLAAPFFSNSERAFNGALVDFIELEQPVFSPFRDGIRMHELVANGMSVANAAELVWKCDVGAIQKCSMVLAVLDGRVPDEGVCVEIGLAKALDKKVVGYLTDNRACFKWGMNPMVIGAIDVFVSSNEELLFQILTGR
jgi:nucleoside 2-deoxyribosyltransferase